LRVRAQSFVGRSALQALIVVVALGLRCVPARAADASQPDHAQAVDPSDDTVGAAPEVWDPIEPFNRHTLDFNLAANRWFFDPVPRVYDFVVPSPVRKSVRRFLINLDSPAVFANDLLQLAPLDAAVTVVRFGFNSTVGLGG